MKPYLQLLEESLPAPDHPRYAAWRAYALSSEERAAPAVKALQRLIDIPGASVLDLGCGDGGYTTALGRAGAQVVAIDIDRASVARTRARLSEQCVSALVTLASAESLPLTCCSLDAVVAQDMIEHVRDPVRVLREVNRVLRVGGLCLISAANRFAWASVVADPHWGLAGVSLMPRWLAAWYVCKVRRRARLYDVWYLPSRGALSRWLRASNLQLASEPTRSRNPCSDFGQSVISIVAVKVGGVERYGNRAR